MLQIEFCAAYFCAQYKQSSSPVTPVGYKTINVVYLEMNQNALIKFMSAYLRIAHFTLPQKC